MLTKTFKTIILVVMLLNGLLFVSNIYVLGDREAAIEMHDDLPPTAGALMVNAKVVLCFVVGILYLVSAVGIFRGKYNLALGGLVGFALFDGFYILQLIMWARIHPRIWFDFSIFGGVSLVLGIFSWWHWRKRLVPAD